MRPSTLPAAPAQRSDARSSPTTTASARRSASRGLSLRRQLLLWLLLPQLLLWLVGGTLAYNIALEYAMRGIDQSLTQSVLSLARQVKPIGSGLLIDFPRAAQAILEEDPQDPVSYTVTSPPGRFILGNVGNALLAPPGGRPEVGAPVLYNAVIDGRAMRLVALELDYGDANSPQRMRVQVAKSLVTRQRIARELVFDMLAPVLVLGGLLSLLVYAGVTRGLKPLAKLEAQLHRSSAHSLSPIEIKDAPLEVRALALAVNQLLDAVRGTVDQERRFLSDAAHQLRTPLAGLKSQLDLALTETDPGALQARLRKVNSAVERSAHLVQQMLALARSEGQVELSPLDLDLLCHDLARAWAPRLLAQGVDFGYEGGQRLQVQGNAVLLREALGNLLDNALRYARPAATGQALSMTLRTRAQDGLALAEVEDDGVGLPEAMRERVFERFVRGSDQPGGVGLGLPIVREIARRHHGDVELNAVQPHGLRVALVLPLRMR